MFRRNPEGTRAPCGRLRPAFRTPAAYYTLHSPESGGHTMQIELEQLPQLRVATLTHVGAYNQIGEAFARLGPIAAAAGLFALPGAMMLAMYDDDPDGKPVEELRSRAGSAFRRMRRSPLAPKSSASTAARTRATPTSARLTSWAMCGRGSWARRYRPADISLQMGRRSRSTGVTCARRRRSSCERICWCGCGERHRV